MPLRASEKAAIPAPRPAKPRVSHNLNGQRIGRKGRETRARIVAAALELIAEGDPAAVTLSAVARRVPIGMTSLYAYFSDLTELLLAVLEPVVEEAETAYLRHLREPWPDEALAAHCLQFVTAFHAYWQRHTHILHFRNALSDQRDRRMMALRVSCAIPVIEQIVRQMGHDPSVPGNPANGMATVLYTGIERVAAVVTDRVMPTVLPGEFRPNVASFLASEAQLLEFGIREIRKRAA